jgi:hypothetical protein
MAARKLGRRTVAGDWEEGETPTFEFKLEVADRERLRTAAAEEGTSVAAIVRRAVKRELKRVGV